jgi:hypothetical protein
MLVSGLTLTAGADWHFFVVSESECTSELGAGQSNIFGAYEEKNCWFTLGIQPDKVFTECRTVEREKTAIYDGMHLRR